MSLMVPRRKHEHAPATSLNQEVAHDLMTAAGRSFTGVIEVTDKGSKALARLYLYEGGLYAIDLVGFAPRVFARLRSAGAFDARTTQDLAVLAGLDNSDPQAGALAVERGWLTVDALAGVHQEFLLASLGGVLSLGKVKTNARKSVTASRFCTLPLPVDPLFDVVRMRGDRLQGTWSMLLPGTSPAAAVLRGTRAPLDEFAGTPELRAIGGELDGVRSLDAVAWSLGFTRAEAVHLACELVRSGSAVIVDGSSTAPDADHLLVPEAFGSYRVSRGPSSGAAPVEAPVPVAAPVLRAAAPARASIEAARSEVTELLAELQESLRQEQEAVARVADVTRRLRSAREELSRLEVADGA